MNGAVSRARLGINCWLALTPLFGYYFAPVWGTIVLMARPGKPQFSSGQIFTESSNPFPSSGESSTNHTLRSNVSLDRDPARVLASVNAGEKMHQRAGVKDVCGRSEK
jgi:hypothetical protein